jgi:hypothetical protein
MKPLANISKTTLINTLLVFVLASYAAIRILNLSQAVQKIKMTADTTSYIRISRETIFGTRFLAGSRPFVFPLVLKLFGNDMEAVAWAQGIFSIVSWSILAISVAYSLHIFFLRITAFALILLLSLYRYIIGWDSVILTESLSLSFLALFIAGWFWLMKSWGWQKVISILIVALLWAFCRDTNAWVILMVAFFLLLLLALRLIDRKYLIFSVAFMIIFFLSNLSADVGNRWVFPFQNVLGRRILPNAQSVDFFANCGMPVSPALMQLTGEYANSQDRAFYEDPALEDYRLWLHQAGKRCYVKWLLSDLVENIKRPLAEFNTLISMQNIQSFLFSKKFSPVLPARVEAIIFPRQQLLILFAVVTGITLLALLSRAWRQNKVWWIIIVLNVLVFPHYFIVWHGDIMGIYRHVLTVSIQFYLGMWILLLLALDSVLSFKISQESPLNKLFARQIEQSRN